MKDLHFHLAVHVKALLHGHVHLSLGLAANSPGGLFPDGLGLGQLSLQMGYHLPVTHLHHRQTCVNAFEFLHTVQMLTVLTSSAIAETQKPTAKANR